MNGTQFVIEYAELRDGEPVVIRRPIADYPSWLAALWGQQCPPTHRREEAVKTLIALGWAWDGKDWIAPAPAEQGGRVDEGLFQRACEVVHHETDCPAIGGNGDADCRCDAVPFLRDLNTFLTKPTNEDAVDRAVDAFHDVYDGVSHNLPEDAGRHVLATAALAQNAQGDAVAEVDAGEDGLFVEILYGPDGSPLKIGDKLYLHADLQNTQREAMVEVTDGAGKFAYLGGSPALPAGTKLYTHAERARVPTVVREVMGELEKALRKFPTWPTDPLHAVGVFNEEAGELSKAVLQQVYEPHKNKPEDVRKEAQQAAAMALRFLVSLDSYDWTPGVQHDQPALANHD